MPKPDDGGPPAPSDDGGIDEPTLASRYPGDVGLADDPAVVWAEPFEEASVDELRARYDDSKNAAGMSLVVDKPTKSSGSKSLQLVAGTATAVATDLYKQLPNADEWYVRYYVRYQPGVRWHHSGMWIGGYNPPLSYPSPQAGLKPNGDDRFSIAIEPIEGLANAPPRLDFYNYWMQMHSWMEVPSGDTAYYGNPLVHRGSFTTDEGQWICVESHVRLNPDPLSKAGAILEVWKNDALVIRFDDTGPLGYWIRDKFCPTGADQPACTDYPAPADTTLDLRFRSTTALQLNAFWPQNYVTDDESGAIWLDDAVVAKTRVGCIK